MTTALAVHAGDGDDGDGTDASARATGRSGARHGVAGAWRAALTWLALGAPARVFVLEGADPPGPVDELRLRDDVRLVDTPRSATVLLVSGWLPESLHEAAMRAHDAMAHPRAVVWWAREPAPGSQSPFPNAVTVRPVADYRTSAVAPALEALPAVLRRVHAELVRGARASDLALLPDVEPAPWRGQGPFGQGGSGMTGGVPYGRPMAGRAPDRDGLELDQLPVRVGPFFAPFPAGLTLDVKLQGDVVQDVSIPGNPFAVPAAVAGAAGAEAADPFRAALTAPVPIADLERARARHHLRWLARALRVHGLDALARRTLAIAVTLVRELPPGAADEVATLGRLLERSRALGWATAGVGGTAPALVANRDLGPVARAAGLAEDARVDDPAYRALGFAPAVQRRRGDADADGDARARWRQRVAEAVQSLELAGRAGDRRTGGSGASIEGARGRVHASAGNSTPSAALLALLPDLLRGQEWGDVVTTVVSLDIDMREAAPGAAPLAPPPAPTPSGGMGGGGMGSMGRMHGGAGGGGGRTHHAHDGSTP